MRSLTAKMTYEEAYEMFKTVGGHVRSLEAWVKYHQSVDVPDFLAEEHAEVLARGIAMLEMQKRDLAKAEKILARFRKKWIENELVALDKRFRQPSRRVE